MKPYLLVTIDTYGPVCRDYATEEARDEAMREEARVGMLDTHNEVLFIDLGGQYPNAYQPNLEEYQEAT